MAPAGRAARKKTSTRPSPSVSRLCWTHVNSRSAGCSSMPISSRSRGRTRRETSRRARRRRRARRVRRWRRSPSQSNTSAVAALRVQPTSPRRGMRCWPCHRRRLGRHVRRTRPIVVACHKRRRTRVCRDMHRASPALSPSSGLPLRRAGSPKPSVRSGRARIIANAFSLGWRPLLRAPVLDVAVHEFAADIASRGHATASRPPNRNPKVMALPLSATRPGARWVPGDSRTCSTSIRMREVGIDAPE